jgi:hypothetical protein
MLKCTPEWRAFRRSTRHVAATQRAILQQILAPNQRTDFGRFHHFAGIRTPRQYQEQVPLSTYESYAAGIERIAAGERNVLTHDRIELLEPTSGTTAGEKLIPYTNSLRRQFQRGVATWVADLLWQRPAVRRGRAYWSLSPALGRNRLTPGGIPVGFDDDAAYLGMMERLALDRLLIVPPEVARIASLESFRYCTLWYLLQAEDMALISVWNPTFLTALLRPLDEWGERLCFDIGHGTLHPPAAALPEVKGLMQRRRRGDTSRAGQLKTILRSRLSLGEKLQQIWPALALISCWADAAAARALGGLHSLFPGVEIQPKGLLATEACVTIPLIGRCAPALAIRSHFFEFEEVDAATAPRPCRLAHELDRGGSYRVVVTTGGGLYRYQLRDEVQVVGFQSQCPLLQFMGKSDRTSDLVGEKLAEPHVHAVLGRVLAAHGLSPRFALLVPLDESPARYRLYLQGPDISAGASQRGALATAVQTALEENPHYAYAVGMGQLASVEVQLLDPHGEPGWLVYERRCLARGQRAGDIKPAALDPWTGWPHELRQLEVEQPSGGSPSGRPRGPARTR